MAQLRELVDLFNNDCLDYEITITLRGEQVKRAQLSSDHTRLGWSSWLGDASPTDESVTFKFKGWKHGRG
jgi:predicted component of type VI protein secretion system